MSHRHHAFADTISELVIPETDTPGASAAGVGGFVLFAMDRGMGGLSLALIDRVRTSLDRVAGGDFLAVTSARRAQLLADLDRRTYAGDAHEEDSSEYAWRRVKGVIVAGYYTSEIGASKELAYEPAPGRFVNITLTPDFRARSNDVQGGAL